MITASSLIALVEARGAKEATAQLLEVGAASDTAGEKIKSMAVGGLLVAGAAAIGFGAASVKMAGDFEQSTNLLITSAGEVPKNIDLIRQGLLKMSVDTATPVSQLVKGMFNVESAGYRGADALKVEKAAAEGAKVENADLAAVTDVLTTAMHNYHLPASQAVDVMNSFRMAASQGKMHMDDLTAALTNVLPVASQAGVSLSNVEAALSTMTQSGDRGAAAGTHLAQMLIYLENPSKKATGVLKEVGLTTQQISDEMKISLPGAIEMITHAVGEKFPVGSAKYIAALSTISGGNKSARAMFELSGASINDFIKNLALLDPTMKANATAVDGWTTVQSNFNFKLEAAKNAVEALMISVGEKLLPVVGQLADAVTPVIQAFSDWVTAGGKVSDQLGVLQPAFQAARDILPDIGTFLTQAGDDIATNLLPPLESLITNVGVSVSLISTWADKSGTAKAVINDLGFAVNVTSQAVGTLVGWTSELIRGFNEDTPAAESLKIVLIGLAGAFVALKVVDTATQFGQFFSKLNEGEGIVSNLASSFKNKLAKAADDFLTNQAPNFKNAIDGITGSADAAAEAETKVATAPTSGAASAKQWFADLEASLTGVEGQANAAAAAEEGVGTTAETKMASGVEVGSAESVASLEGVGTAATTAKGEIATVGPAMSATAATGVSAFGALALGITAAAIGAIFGMMAYMEKDAAPALVQSWQNADFKPPPRFAQSMMDMKRQSQDTTAQLTANANTAKNKMIQSSVETAQGITGEYTWMKNESLSTVQGFTSDAIKMLGKMGTDGANIMQSLDKSTQLYWNDIANYINLKSNEAAMDANRNLGKISINYKLYGNVNSIAGKNVNDSSDNLPGHAAGTTSSPGGLHWLGENEPELVVGRQTGYVPQGASVIPLSHMQGGLGGGGNNQPIHIHVEVGGHEVLSYLIDHMGNAMMQQSILQYGGRRW